MFPFEDIITGAKNIIKMMPSTVHSGCHIRYSTAYYWVENIHVVQWHKWGSHRFWWMKTKDFPRTFPGPNFNNKFHNANLLKIDHINGISCPLQLFRRPISFKGLDNFPYYGLNLTMHKFWYSLLAKPIIYFGLEIHFINSFCKKKDFSRTFRKNYQN